MKSSQNCINLIKKFEGCSLNPYLCPAKKPTIGYGTTFYADGSPVSMKDRPITQEQADALLLETLKTYEECVNYYVKVDINQNQFDSLVSFAYNLGCAKLKISTLLKLINLNPKNPLIKEQYLKWTFAGGQMLKGLYNRRVAESNLYFKPK